MKVFSPFLIKIFDPSREVFSTFNPSWLSLFPFLVFGVFDDDHIENVRIWSSSLKQTWTRLFVQKWMDWRCNYSAGKYCQKAPCVRTSSCWLWCSCWRRSSPHKVQRGCRSVFPAGSGRWQWKTLPGGAFSFRASPANHCCQSPADTVIFFLQTLFVEKQERLVSSLLALKDTWVVNLQTDRIHFSFFHHRLGFFVFTFFNCDGIHVFVIPSPHFVCLCIARSQSFVQPASPPTPPSPCWQWRRWGRWWRSDAAHRTSTWAQSSSKPMLSALPASFDRDISFGLSALKRMGDKRSKLNLFEVFNNNKKLQISIVGAPIQFCPDR